MLLTGFIVVLIEKVELVDRHPQEGTVFDDIGVLIDELAHGIPEVVLFAHALG